MRPSKREHLLDTAERLFYAEGFHATGIDRVVGEAGIARMTLYNHFTSKEALIEAVLERRYRRYLTALSEAVEKAVAGSAVEAVVDVHCRWLATISDSGCIVIKAIAEFERHHPPIADLGRGLKRDLLAIIAEAVRRDRREADAELSERLLVVLEGADALVPVLGAAAVTRHVHALVASMGIAASPA